LIEVIDDKKGKIYIYIDNEKELTTSIGIQDLCS